MARCAIAPAEQAEAPNVDRPVFPIAPIQIDQLSAIVPRPRHVITLAVAYLVRQVQIRPESAAAAAEAPRVPAAPAWAAALRAVRGWPTCSPAPATPVLVTSTRVRRRQRRAGDGPDANWQSHCLFPSIHPRSSPRPCPLGLKAQRWWTDGLKTMDVILDVILDGPSGLRFCQDQVHRQDRVHGMDLILDWTGLDLGWTVHVRGDSSVRYRFHPSGGTVGFRARSFGVSTPSDD